MSEQSELEFGAVGAEAEAFQYAVTSTRTFDKVLLSLATEIDSVGLRLLQEIDVQKALAEAGRTTGGFRLLFFFHPRSRDPGDLGGCERNGRGPTQARGRGRRGRNRDAPPRRPRDGVRPVRQPGTC